MATFTLLDITQQILSSMDSDEVNSISDTVESNQVALIVRGVFFDLSTDLGLAEHETLFELNASGDTAKPTLMTLPSTCKKLSWVKYNNKLATETYANYQEVCFLPAKDFQEMNTGLKDTADGSMNLTLNGETFEFLYRNDAFPTYYTTFDDQTLVFDSYDAGEDTTLQKSKTMCSGFLFPVFTLSDTFTPDLSPAQFSLLINRAKERAFVELKQTANLDASKEARRQKIINQKNRHRVQPQLFRGPPYGRNSY